MNSTNEIRLVGTLQDMPRAEQSKNGHSRCRFNLITREKTFGGVNYDNRLKVHMYGKNADFALNYLRPGSLVLVKGRAKPYHREIPDKGWENGFYIQGESIDGLANYGNKTTPPEDISYNEVLLMGYLAKDAKDKERTGLPVVELTLMTNENKLLDNNKPIQRAESHKIIVFSEPVIRQARKLLKGDLVLLAGRYQNHSFKTADNHWINLFEVVTTKPQLVSRKPSSK